MRKFGIELEVSGISKEQAAEALTSIGISAAAENYNHRTRNYWKVTTDSSITSENGLSCELVSPILNYREETFAEISRIVAALKSMGAVVNNSCGMHVHVDCRGIYDPDFYRLLLSFYSKYEKEIDSFVHESRRENQNNYCRTNVNLYNDWETIWSNHIDQSPETNLADAFSNVERYYKLNFASFLRHGTVEFRQFHGTLNPKEIRAWVDFCINLVNQTYAACTEASSKQRLKKPKTSLIQQKMNFANYVVFAANKSRRLNGIQEEISNPYDALVFLNKDFLGYINPYSPSNKLKEFKFTNAEINSIFVTFFYTFREVCNKAHNASRNSGSNDQIFRDASFENEVEMIVLFTALFFEFTGTESEIKRKVYSKLRNLKVYRNGYFVNPPDEFYTFFEHAVDSSAPTPRNYNRNKFLRTITAAGTYNPNKFERVGTIQRLFYNCFNELKRFWVSNPRNLRSVINNEYTRERINIYSAIFYTFSQIRYVIDDLYVDAIYHDLSNPDLINLLSINGLKKSKLFINASQVYKEMNPVSFEKINKEPYFEFVNSLRENSSINKTFENLKETDKVIPANVEFLKEGIDEATQTVTNLRQIREREERQARERQNPRPEARRILTEDFDDDINEIIRELMRIRDSRASLERRRQARQFIYGLSMGSSISAEQQSEIYNFITAR